MGGALCSQRDFFQYDPSPRVGGVLGVGSYAFQDPNCAAESLWRIHIVNCNARSWAQAFFFVL